MSVGTTRLNLTKPGGGSTGLILPADPVDIDVLNANFDKIDDSIGAKVVTSTTRPATPFNGQIIKETDTKRTRVYNQGTASWDADATARGGLTRYKVTDLASLDVIADAEIGDEAFMTDPGLGNAGTGTIDGLKWEAFAGAGSTIDWRVQDTIVATTKATLDSFIAAVVAITGTDEQFKVGSFAFVSSTLVYYRFITTAGVLEAQTGRIKPSGVAGSGAVINADGTVTVTASTNFSVLGVGLAEFDYLKVRASMTAPAATAINYKHRTGGSDVTGTSYQYTYSETNATTVARLGGTAAGSGILGRLGSGGSAGIIEADFWGLMKNEAKIMKFHSFDSDLFADVGGGRNFATLTPYPDLTFLSTSAMTGTIEFIGVGA